MKAAINVRNLLFRTARTTGYRVGLGGEKSNDSTLRKIKFFHEDKRIFFSPKPLCPVRQHLS